MTNAIPRREFAVLFSALLLVAAGNTAMQTVLPGIARSIGIPDLLVAFVFSISALLWTFSAPYWARQSDVRGRRQLVEVGVTAFGVSMLGCGLVVYAGLNGLIGAITTFVIFAMMRMVFGIFGSAANPACFAFVAARTSEAERTSALSMLSSAFGLGTILGPAMAPLFVIGSVGLSGPMLAFTIIAIIVWLCVRNFLTDDSPKQDASGYGAAASEPLVMGGASGASLRAATAEKAPGIRPKLQLRDARIAPFMLFGFASGSVQAATGQAMGFLIIDRTGGNPALSAQYIAIVFMAGAGATLLAQWGLIPKLGLTPPPLMRWGTLIAATGAVAIALATDFHGLVIGFALASLGYGLARPGYTAGASLAVSRAEQAGVAGAVTAINGACFIAGPAIGIGLYTLKPELPYWLGAAALALLLSYAWLNPVLGREPLHDV